MYTIPSQCIILSCFFLQGIVLIICMSVFIGSVLALGAIVSAKPLDDLRYKGWNDQKSLVSPYTSSVFLGWAMASAIGLVITSVLPIISWFATYRFSLSSAILIGIFAGIFLLYILLYIFILLPHILASIYIYISILPADIYILLNSFWLQ